jgi:hypothetical protein
MRDALSENARFSSANLGLNSLRDATSEPLGRGCFAITAETGVPLLPSVALAASRRSLQKININQTGIDCSELKSRITPQKK